MIEIADDLREAKATEVLSRPNLRFIVHFVRRAKPLPHTLAGDISVSIARGGGMANNETCPTCHGTGREICPSCRGSRGEWVGNVWEQCEACLGSGTVHGAGTTLLRRFFFPTSAEPHKVIAS